MHRHWYGARVGKEWFDLSGPSDISNVITQINNLEAQYGPQVQQLRGVYYATPTPGHNSTLTPAQITQAEQLRDDVLVRVEQMAFNLLWIALLHLPLNHPKQSSKNRSFQPPLKPNT